MSTILIVEDDESILEVVQMLLEDEGLATLAAATADEALAALGWEFDLVLLDLGVSGLNTEDYVRRLKDRATVPPILLCSASPHLQQMARMLNCIPIAKPFQIEYFVKTVKRALVR